MPAIRAALESTALSALARAALRLGTHDVLGIVLLGVLAFRVFQHFAGRGQAHPPPWTKPGPGRYFPKPADSFILGVSVTGTPGGRANLQLYGVFDSLGGANHRGASDLHVANAHAVVLLVAQLASSSRLPTFEAALARMQQSTPWSHCTSSLRPPSRTNS